MTSGVGYRHWHPLRPRDPKPRVFRPGSEKVRWGSATLDGGIFLAAGSLILLGVVMSYSATAALSLDRHIPPLFLKHVTALCLGGAGAAAGMWLPPNLWRRASLPLWLLSMGLLIATLLYGVEVRGAQRWLVLPLLELRFQPVELAKLSTLLLVVSVASRREGHSELSRRRVLVVFGLSLAPVGLLLGQPDFGNAVLLLTLVALVLLVAGTPMRVLVLPALATSVGAAIYIATHAYAWRRVACFSDPWKEAAGCGFQLVQSFVAFSKGGLLGVGLGNGHQKLAFLPEAHTDFILALVAEELGLLGVLAVFGAFAVLFFAGNEIARRTSDRFSLLLAFAMTVMLTVPAVVNAAVVMGVVPTKGLTLPFLSHGGTSLVTSCTVLGLLLGVSRRSRSPRPMNVVTGGGARRPA